MHPHLEIATHVGHGPRLVDGAGVGRAEVGDDGEQSVDAVVVERGVQRGTGHPAPLVGRDEHDVDVHHPRRGVDRRVRLPGGREAPTTAGWLAMAGAGVMAGGDERGEVGRRATGDEAATGAVREPGHAGEPLERLVLGGDRAGATLPQAGEDARRADDEVEQVGGRRRCGGHMTQVHRMIHRPAGVHQHVAEQRQRLVAADALRADRALERADELIGGPSAPRRVLGHLQPLDGVADHRVGEQVGPLVPLVHGSIQSRRGNFGSRRSM